MISIKPQLLKFYIILALISLFSTLWLPYVGEEAVYTISSYEMWFHHNYWVNTLYGVFYGRPPLLNWCIILIAKAIGWSHVLIASRLVSALSTTLVALGVYWFMHRLVKSTYFALTCSAVYLTGDLLLFRGWLAYSDPLLALCVFFSIAFLWLSVEEQRRYFLILSSVFLSAGFLVKALSPYWFYGLSGFVLLIFHKNRQFIVQPVSIVIYIIALSFPFIWNLYADPRYLPAMWSEVINTAFAPTLSQYLYQVVIVQPGLLLIRLAPISLIILFYYFKQVKYQLKIDYCSFAKIAFWIAFLNFAVCWFAPRWPEARYYMPVFPFMAICMAYVIWNLNIKSSQMLAFSLLLVLLVKCVLVGYSYYRYNYLEPDYQREAADILSKVSSAPLTADIQTLESAPVEKVAIYLNLLRFPQQPLQVAPGIKQKKKIPVYHCFAKDQCNGIYVIGQLPTAIDRIVKKYSKGRTQVDLWYRHWNEKS